MPQTEVELRVDGIDGESDADEIEEQLLGTPGVTRVRVDPEAADQNQPLRSALERLGYEVTDDDRDPSV